MLRDLSIQNYRCFKDFHIDGLARVNLIVGANNIGKTSFLEAVYLLVNQVNPICLIDMLEDRGEFVSTTSEKLLGGSGIIPARRYQIQHIFYDNQLENDSAIYLRSQKESLLSLKIELHPLTSQSKLIEDTSESDLLIQDADSADISIFELDFSYGSYSPMRFPVSEDGLVERKSFRLGRKKLLSNQVAMPQPCQFLTTNSITRFDELAKLWNKILLTPEEESVVTALKILDKNIERIGFYSRPTYNSGIIVKIRGKREPIPLGSMGEGMRRILALAIASVTVENGFLLVDEIETGLYYETQTDMWRLILETAQRLNVQVFATTHSWDCIAAFQEALSQLDDSSVGKLFRLSRRDEDIRAVEYTPDELSIAVRQSIEVR